MNIAVCIKQVPEVTDADLEIDQDGTDVIRDDLAMVLNEWDDYALEEAIRLKETHGGNVTVITLGDQEAEDVLRRGLAMGADAAIRIDDEDFVGSDALGVARGLQRALRDVPFDLVLTGAQSADNGWGQVGGLLAELLGVPHVSMAVQINIEDGDRAVVCRELESNVLERIELPLPGLVTVQTGINQPRYVSVMGIRKVRRLAIEELDTDDLGLEPGAIGSAGSSVESRQLEEAPRGRGAQMLTGPIDLVADRIAQIIRTRQGSFAGG